MTHQDRILQAARVAWKEALVRLAHTTNDEWEKGERIQFMFAVRHYQRLLEQRRSQSRNRR